MKIITKALSRADLLDIIVKLDPVALDLTLINGFFKESEPLVPFDDLKADLERLQIQLPNNLTDFQESETFFPRAYQVFLLLAILKNKSQIRRELCDFLILMLNNNINSSLYCSHPSNIMYSFYGKDIYLTRLDPIPKPPGVTFNEKKVLLPLLENMYYFALSTVVLFKAQTTLSLGELAFGLFCEQNSINPDFLRVKYEKRGNNKFVSPTANNILNFVLGSKLNKSTPKATITTWVDLVAQVKSIVQENLNSILEEVDTEESENLQELDLKDKAYNSKDILFFNTQAHNLINSVLAVIQNDMNRLNEVKSIEKELSFKLDELSQKFLHKQDKLFDVLKVRPHTQDSGFGVAFGPMFYANSLINTLYEFIVIEALSSLIGLETQNQNMALKASKEKGNESAKKIQLGKGTSQIYAKIEEEFFCKLTTKTINNDTITQFSQILSPFNLELQDLIEDIVSPKNNETRRPKVPKGTCDMDPPQMALRRMAIDMISSIFRKHGAVEIDTPVFELRETLMGKYGEASKLIYDLQDQGGEQLSLRYDLTVPFARYLALKGNITNMKRLHIAKVYRRDQPQVKKGRFREFYQCDYDIVGNHGVMIPDAECIIILNEIFNTLDIGKVVIKLNHRKLLDAMIEIAGAPKQKFKAICSSIDRLDKESWIDVRQELITEKGLTEQAADKLGELVQLRGSPLVLLDRLIKEDKFIGSKEGENVLKEMDILFKYLHEVNCTENVVFDLSLARGLDYYTGLIYEAVLEDNSGGLGSIAGGGRYDELIGSFSNKELPAVGLSIGIERVFGLLEKKYEKSSTIRACETEFLVGTIGSGMVIERFKLCKMLWDNDFKTEMLFNENPKPEKQLQYAVKNQIPFVLWIGQEEVKNKTVKIKCLYREEEHEVSRDVLIPELKRRIELYYSDLAKGAVDFEPGKLENEKA